MNDKEDIIKIGKFNFKKKKIQTLDMNEAINLMQIGIK